MSAPGFKDYRDRTHDFEGVAVENQWNVNLTGTGEPERLAGSKVSALFFPTLGVAPLHGRVFLPEEDAKGHDHEAILSYGLWQRDFGGDGAIVGKQASLNGEAYDIVGVMPASFVDPWNALVDDLGADRARPGAVRAANYTNEFMPLTARLKPGVPLQQAVRDMAAFAERLKKDIPDHFSPDWTLEVKTLDEVKTGPIRPALLVLLGAVGFVLLIACANVANLMLARAAARHKEVAIRTALGANRWSLVRQLLTESVLLSFIGGAVGLLLAYVSIRGACHHESGEHPRHHRPRDRLARGAVHARDLARDRRAVRSRTRPADLTRQSPRHAEGGRALGDGGSRGPAPAPGTRRERSGARAHAAHRRRAAR